MVIISCIDLALWEPYSGL